MADNDKKRYYWVKLDRNFFEKYKIKSLLSEKNGESFCLIYQQLMCECLNYIDEKNNGILRFSKQRAYTINELANVINRKPKQLTEALKMLENKELLKVLDDGTIVIFDVNVGSITGQTIRKNKVNNVVENTNDLPNNYQLNEVKNTLDIRDKSIEIRDKSIITRFIKPSIEQIQEYINERQCDINASKFYDYYESVGWKVGNKPMKDWKACVRTWERKIEKPAEDERKYIQEW